MGSRVGVVVRALAFHQCVSGSIPEPGVICGLSLLVLCSAPNSNKLFVLLQLARGMVTLSQQIDNRDTPSKVKEIQQIDLCIMATETF